MMQVIRDFGLLTLAAGMAVFGDAGKLAAQNPNQQQNPNQGQQPSSTSAFPSANDALPGGSTNTKSGSVGDTMGDAQSRQMDKRFLLQMSQASMLNIEMGKMAVQKASNDAVKQFGQKMATDHERGVDIVKRVATRDGVVLPDGLDSKHKERLDKLAKLSGPEFDRAYVKDQLKAHQRMVSYFQSEADNGTETAARKMATNMLPAVQSHLESVKELNKTLSASAAK